MSAAWSFFFNHWATSRQIDKFDRWSGGPGVPHNSIAACLTSSRSGCLRAACGVIAVVDAWRFSQLRKSSSTIANSELLIGSMWSSLMIRSSPDLSASRTTAAALPVLTLRRWQTSAMACPNDSNREFYPFLYSLSASTMPERREAAVWYQRRTNFTCWRILFTRRAFDNSSAVSASQC